MLNPSEVAREALLAMRKARGEDALFSSDEIWKYTSHNVPSANRPAAINWLRKNNLIEQTGAMRHAVTEARAGSNTPEYRFVRSGQSPTKDIVSLCSDFTAECKAVMAVNPDGVLRFTSALLAKRFTIFTGLAGSGKTKLAQAFARWITQDPGWVESGDHSKGKNVNPFYALVPVGADWTGNENVLGYPNGLNSKGYVTKPALEIILHALENLDVPHFLILDEMNLSHVERYFADILSIIESGDGLDLYAGDMTKEETWREKDAQMCVPPKLRRFPENLFIIGTVNVDETTYMFSPKVLDRANVIEFRMDADELGSFLNNPIKPDLSKLDGKGIAYAKGFVQAAKNPVDIPANVKQPYATEMLLFFNATQAHGAEFGYRLAHESARFVHFYKVLGKHSDMDASWFPGAFDCVVFQKLLPKLHGSRAKLGPLLKKLWFLCVSDETARGTDALKAAVEAATSTDKKNEPSSDVPAGAPYPLSADKIARMWRLLNENGFASFAEA